MRPITKVDRAALVRRSLVELVAERGFRGASMAAVAEHAGVATGTAYVHYRSKDELMLAAYKEVKADLGQAAVDGLDMTRPPEERFRTMWLAIRDHLSADPVRARFLLQVDASPYAGAAHEAAISDEDTSLIDSVGADMVDLFVDLPGLVVYDLSVGPIVRIVARGEVLGSEAWQQLATSCWRAITE